MNRISKKTKHTKEYTYALRCNYLVYFKQKDTRVFTGFIKLGPEIIIEKKSLVGKNSDIHYIEVLKDGNVRKLFSKDLLVVMKLYNAIRKKCIL